MATNSKETALPQEMGVKAAIDEVKRYPDGSPEQRRLLEIIAAGRSTLSSLTQPPPSPDGNYPPQGRVKRGKNKRKGLTPTERADQVAQQMAAAGKSPQEIGAVTAKILESEG